MKSRKSLIGAGVGFGAVLVAASTLGVVQSRPDDDPAGPPLAAGQPATFVATPGAALDDTIASLESRVERVPGDHVAWASLGMAYVQQARVTGDGDVLALAETALDTSLEIDEADNYLAHAGRAALSSNGHDFVAARDHALEGLDINGYSPLLWGALSDAQLQLGDYDAAAGSVQRMLDLSPDASALARASYVRELHGDLDQATSLMRRALDASLTAADRSFAHHHLGNLAFDAGDPATALEHYDAALAALPESSAVLAVRARACAALGRTDEAIAEYEALVALDIEPFYRLHYAEVLDAAGRDDDAAVQYERFRQEESAMSANEPLPHAAFTLFLADHGHAELALSNAERAIAVAPFIEAQDAYAWALHRNGRHEEAWTAMQRAFELDTPNALFHYHAGMIRLALDDEAGAREHLRRALDINPHFHPVAAVEAADTLASLGG